MVRLLVEQRHDGAKCYVVAAGLSTDEKPKGVITGSKFTAVDTGKRYLYDETGNGTWYEDKTIIK